MIGQTQTEIEGQPVWEALKVHDPDGRRVPWDQRLLHAALETRQLVQGRFAEILVPQSGESIPTDLSAAPILDERGELLGAVQVVRDLRPEAELERMKGALMASVSHEFRTPLAVIRGFGELLGMGKLTPSQIAEAAKQILSAYERLSEVVEDLLILSGVEKGTIDPKVEDVDLSLLVQDYISSQGLDKSVRVKVDGHVPSISGDVRTLKRVLKMLLAEAMKRATSGNFIDVVVRSKDGRVQVEIGNEQPSRSWKDSREQIPDEDIAFPLHIAQKLIELQRGKLSVGSKASPGSVFSFSLPVR